jgi:pimeloyl-ACP methyl ester carboxylesterase
MSLGRFSSWTAGRPLSDNAVEVVVIPGACSTGLTWKPVADLVGLRILPVPGADSVPEMAEALLPDLRLEHGPRVLVGASLGAVVALDLMDRVRVDVAVLVAAGLGITVDERVLERVRTSEEDVLLRIARSSLAVPENENLLALAVADLRSRGRGVLVQHLSALASHHATVPARTPETFVVWGEHDRSVLLQDHLELTQVLEGVLFPVRGAGHLPFLENPRRVADIIKLAARHARALGDPIEQEVGSNGSGTLRGASR